MQVDETPVGKLMTWIWHFHWPFVPAMSMLSICQSSPQGMMLWWLLSVNGILLGYEWQSKKTPTWNLDHVEGSKVDGFLNGKQKWSFTGPVDFFAGTKNGNAGNGHVFGTHFFVKSCFRLEEIATAICIFDRWKGKEINTDAFLGSICRCLKQMDDEDLDLKGLDWWLTLHLWLWYVNLFDTEPRAEIGGHQQVARNASIDTPVVGTCKQPGFWTDAFLCVSRCMVVQNLGQRKTTLGRVLIHLSIWSSIWTILKERCHSEPHLSSSVFVLLKPTWF